MWNGRTRVAHALAVDGRGGCRLAVVVVAAVAAGWDVAGWLGAVWNSLTSISLVYLVPALALQTLQTAFAAAAWHGILRYAYPEAEVRYLASSPVTRPAWPSTASRLRRPARSSWC